MFRFHGVSKYYYYYIVLGVVLAVCSFPWHFFFTSLVSSLSRVAKNHAVFVLAKTGKSGDDKIEAKPNIGSHTRCGCWFRCQSSFNTTQFDTVETLPTNLPRFGLVWSSPGIDSSGYCAALFYLERESERQKQTNPFVSQRQLQ